MTETDTKGEAGTREKFGTLSPQCVRFRSEDLVLVRKAARREDERVSPWIRSVVTRWTDRTLDSEKLVAPKLVPAGSEVQCVRFKPLAMKRIELAAKSKNMAIAEWIRAISVAAAKA